LGKRYLEREGEDSSQPIKNGTVRIEGGVEKKFSQWCKKIGCKKGGLYLVGKNTLRQKGKKRAAAVLK